jgi:hypothetical protein
VRRLSSGRPFARRIHRKETKGIERARATAHSVLNRSLNQLRKLLTERLTREQLGLGNPQDTPLADSHKVCQALNLHTRNQKLFTQAASEEIDRHIANAMAGQGPLPAEAEMPLDADGQVASNCEDPIISERGQKIMTWFGLCSCHSGIINKDCCGKSDYENEKKAA